MLFRRRTPKSIALQLREWVWPRSGWLRTFTYIWHRLRRLPGGTSSIAAGFAFGAAVSFMPINGLHFAVAALLAWMTRTSVLASAIGTFVGNPWTFPPIWLGTYYLGRIMLGHGGEPEDVNFRAVFSALWHGIRDLDAHHLAEHVWPVWWPMLVGSLPITVLAWLVFYWLLKQGMISYHRRHGLKRLQKLAARARTGNMDLNHGGRE